MLFGARRYTSALCAASTRVIPACAGPISSPVQSSRPDTEPLRPTSLHARLALIADSPAWAASLGLCSLRAAAARGRAGVAARAAVQQQRDRLHVYTTILLAKHTHRIRLFAIPWYYYDKIRLRLERSDSRLFCYPVSKTTTRSRLNI